jgi:hypothetical protein
LWIRHRYAKSGVMPTDPKTAVPSVSQTEGPEPATKKRLTPAAERALAEAAQRRAGRDREPSCQPEEFQGRGGLEPTRYGDWEVNGLTSDF